MLRKSVLFAIILALPLAAGCKPKTQPGLEPSAGVEGAPAEQTGAEQAPAGAAETAEVEEKGECGCGKPDCPHKHAGAGHHGCPHAKAEAGAHECDCPKGECKCDCPHKEGGECDCPHKKGECDCPEGECPHKKGECPHNKTAAGE